MLTIIYTYVFIAFVVALLVWQYRANRSDSGGLAMLLFWSSLLVYVAVLFFLQASITHKLFSIALRDIIISLVVALFSRLFVGTSFIRLVLAIVITIAGWLAGKPIMQKSFEQSSVASIASDAELLVDIKNDSDVEKIKTLLSNYNASVQKAFPDLQHNDYSNLDEYYLININDHQQADADDIIKKLVDQNLIDYGEKNEVIQLNLPTVIQKNTKKPLQNYNDSLSPLQWALQALQADRTADILNQNTPARKIKLFVLDTGVDSQHPDIAQHYTSAKKQWDSDVQGHGTHCAGIAAAVSNNRIGTASLAWNNDWIQITSVKVLNDNGTGSQQQILAGIIAATDAGADVISMSLGGPSDDDRQQAYEEAINYASRNGVVIVVAAGNEYDDARQHIPAACKGVIAVAATDVEMQRAEFSNDVSVIEMALAAPGVDIISTFPNNTYRSLSGTSMATPYVASAVALIKAFRPQWNTTEVFELLKKTGIETKNTNETGRFIQPANALETLK